ncbi:hypothetical protein [Lentilactobacillus kefiri]|uniref:Uncharacterized protein n=2 Tax=Lentilactobacillus kefiri TaxID=33962 RepID=A0A8E1RJR8_LENKE|nr:hypothetical protein [Lentilactobacillus kefiri]KRL71686.1 hypothetical protein FD08_GL000314 [Lentilactobacillus parakefiri DSM 10551]KRM52448.1 hypothetical protein FC95_GL001229 [Lentilactobacillus kefiri DSM 20587 = JCM 5818]MCJ2162514.1 hypothetical protein [Lentilactobacillus kefiri]MCP9370090.1 hypothetical protein [Lentilactobacillus kefiri]MDH5109436.1 hypothetical protein [Lentilactobacillus kefiri]
MTEENNKQIKKVSRENLDDIVPTLTRMISDPDGNFSIFDWGHGEIIGIVQHHQDYPDTAIEDVLNNGIKSGLGYKYEPVDEEHFRVDGNDRKLVKGVVASRDTAVLIDPQIPENILDYLKVDMLNTLGVPGLHSEYPGEY